MRSILAIVTVSALSLAALAASHEQANAHATSIGFENAGSPGAVNIWLGTYNHGSSSHHLEGSMNLTGVSGNPFPTTTVPFTIGAGVGPTPIFDGLSANPATTKPAGLIDGVTNFFPPVCSSGDSSPLTGTDPNCFGGVDHWQGATFTGLNPGDYQFSWTPIPNPSAEWSLLNPNMDGVFTLSGAITNPNPVPEPATLGLLGIGVAGLGFVARRRKKH